MTKTLTNFVDGQVAGQNGRDLELVDPVTEEVFAKAAVSSEEEIDAACKAAARAFEGWGQTTPSERQLALLKIADAIEARAEELVAVESENTGKPKALVLSEEVPPMVDQIRFFAGAARVLEGTSAGEYMTGYTSLDPARADRRVRGGDAMELPGDDGRLEVGAGARRRQHDGAEAVRHHAGQHGVDGRADGRVPPRRRVQRRARRPRHGAALVANKIPQMVSITGSVRAGMAVATSAASDVKRVHLESAARRRW